MGRLEEARRRSELEAAVAALESANKILEASLAEEQKECAAAEKECEELEKKATDLAVMVAELKSDLRGSERLLSLSEKEVKRLRDEKTASERIYAENIVNVRATVESLTKKTKSPGYRLEVVGRDGNNDLRSLRVTPEE